jgi:hypothetical protein
MDDEGKKHGSAADERSGTYKSNKNKVSLPFWEMHCICQPWACLDLKVDAFLRNQACRALINKPLLLFPRFSSMPVLTLQGMISATLPHFLP